MEHPLRYRVEGAVAVLTMASPPVNALGAALRRAIAEGLDRAAAEPGLRAVLILAEGRTWPAGADITEFDAPPADPWLPDLCDRIEAFPVPVIAALHGTVLGGGLELALAAHRRVALPGTRLGFPEITLGLLPGAGGTQRTPRLIGAEAALRLMLSGAPVDAEEAQRLGLIDGIVRGDLEAAGLALAQTIAGGGETLFPARDRHAGLTTPRAFMAAVAAARAALRPGPVAAPQRIVDCVEAALLLPEPSGHVFERAAFDDLVASPEAVALRHVFLAERRAARVPELAGVAPCRIATAAVAGHGAGAAAIAVALLSAGLPVILHDPDAAAVSRALERVALLHERAVAAGRMTEDRREEDWGRLSGATDPARLAEADLVVEAGPEEETAKALALSRLAPRLAPGAILALQAAQADPEVLGALVERPGTVISLNLHAPAHQQRLMEIAPLADTRPDVTAALLALARRMGKVAVLSAPVEGMIGARLQAALRTAADLLLEEGATPAQVDRALLDHGFALGPYQLLDLVGIDRAWAPAPAAEGTRRPGIGDRLRALGRTGRRAGRGYYRHDEGPARLQDDPDLLALLEAERERRGLLARPVGAEAIRRRCLAALANEGARLLQAGIARRPSDIDVAMVLGYGFPRHRGGPMLAADQEGLLAMRRELRDLARGEDGWFWTPAPLWDELIKNGRRFASLNEG